MSYLALPNFYDHEYAHLDYLQRDVPFVLSRMPRKSQRVLEIAVGTGRAAIPIAHAGHRVVGVDYDARILAVARRKRDFVGLTDKQLRLVEGNALDLRLREKFDWCLILFNTLLAFPTLDQLDAVVDTAARHLRKGGRFFIDIFNPDFTLVAESHCYGLDPVTFHVPELDLTVSRVTDLEDTAPQIRKVTFHYRWYERGVEKRASKSFPMTWLMPRELTQLLDRHGFTVEQQWGDYAASSKVRSRSPRILTQARKI
jgi:SAM-dependent methyltransferase